MKKLLLSLVALCAVILLGIAALVFWVDPNQFKPLIVEQTKKHTGLELTIDGEIRWSFFPRLGLQLGKTELKNPTGFSQKNLFKVDEVGIDISVMPLFQRQLEVGRIRLDGAQIALETLADGRTNWQSLLGDTSKKAQSDATSSTSSNSQSQHVSQPWSMSVAGISVSDALLDFQDHQAKVYSQLSQVNFELSEFQLGQWSQLSFSVKGKNNQQTFELSAKTELNIASNWQESVLRNTELNASFTDLETKVEQVQLKFERFELNKENPFTLMMRGQAAEMKINAQAKARLWIAPSFEQIRLDALTLTSDLTGEGLPQSPLSVALDAKVAFDQTKNQVQFELSRLQANQLTLESKGSVHLGAVPEIDFQLYSALLDLDEFLGIKPVSEAVEKTAQVEQTQTTTQPTEPDLSALSSVNVKGKVQIDQLIANQVKLQNIQTEFNLKQGVFTLSRFVSQLYQGNIQAKAQLNSQKTPATYQVSALVSDVKVQPLLMDLANNDRLEGTGNIELNLQGASLIPEKLQQNIKGVVDIVFADGAINGFNLAQTIRSGYALVTGKKQETTQEALKTDFSALTATLKLSNGEVVTDNIHMQSPLLRVAGEGKVNHLHQTLNMNIKTSFVGTLEGQGGKEKDELYGLTIPVNISGAWEDPKIKLTLDDVLKQKAKKELERGTEKILEKIGGSEDKKEAVDSLLKGLFKKK